MSTVDFPGFTTPTGNSQDCIDDLLDITDAIAFNVLHGSNNQVWMLPIIMLAQHILTGKSNKPCCACSTREFDGSGN